MAKYKPFKPNYHLFDYMGRWAAIVKAFWGTLKIVGTSKLFSNIQRNAFAASLEITDKCNAGCNYCYVYPSDWDQTQRVKGYLSLDTAAQKQKTQEMFRRLEQIRSEGKVHITLVGGEPTLAPDLIQHAATLFPVVWVVTNGSKSLPKAGKSVTYFVSIDGPPELHNASRDPLNFFAKYRYQNLSGLSAAIVRNINESSRGAFVHITLNKNTLMSLSETVHWLCRDVTKLRGIIISGAATSSTADPLSLLPEDRQKIKTIIEDLASVYGWGLFPFNTSVINDFLFDPQHIIKNPAQCTVARRVDSYDFSGQSTGKCVLRDETSCETCVCNISGLMRGVATGDRASLAGVLSTCFG